jgi:hypothetical protein
MKAIPATAWVGSEDNAIIAQIDISPEEIAALGGIIERSDSQLGPLEAAVFALATGKVVSLSRTEGNPVPGYTLILEGPDHSGVLDQILREAGLGGDRGTLHNSMMILIRPGGMSLQEVWLCQQVTLWPRCLFSSFVLVAY